MSQSNNSADNEERIKADIDEKNSANDVVVVENDEENNENIEIKLEETETAEKVETTETVDEVEAVETAEAAETSEKEEKADDADETDKDKAAVEELLRESEPDAVGKKIVKRKKRKANRVTYYIGMVFVFVAFLLFFSTNWVFAKFGNITLDSIIYQMIAPMDGTDMSYVWSYIYMSLLPTVVIEVVVVLLTNNIYKNNFVWKMGKKEKEIRIFPFIPLRKIMIYVSIVAMVCSVFYTYIRCDVKTYIQNKTTTSSLYEDYYVDPGSADITFPKEKRNLIYLYVESMEKTLESKEEGGGKSSNIIPGLTALQKKYTTVADADGIQGRVLNGGGWTIAGMVSQSAAVPLLLNINGFDYNTDASFLPGAYSIGQILEKNGYYNELITGCGKEFAGTNLFFEQHGNYDILDPSAAKEKGYIPNDYFKFWGYEDTKMFEILKAEITEKYNSGILFNITAATLDSHADDMFICDKCDHSYSDQHDMVYHCTDSQITEFVKWFEQQPCYDNTTLVISGDHLSMATTYYNDCTDYSRSVYSVFVNPQVDTDKEYVRSYTTQDMMPSTLAALGAEIDGDRLGLGTNIFSETPTLCEELGFDELNTLVGRDSNYYNANILKGTGSSLANVVRFKDDGLEVKDAEDMYEKYYADPTKVELNFPETKKNLVYIYVESFEKTMETEENGGALTKDVIPYLTKLQDDNLAVTNDEGKQAYECKGSDWTIAAMVAQSSGIPLLDAINNYDYADDYQFLPGARTIGDILEEQGYQNVFISGFDSKFAATDKFYTQHGNYDIIDYEEAINRKYIPEGYYEHWGYDDAVMFDILKDQIKEKSASGQPFNITCATLDTHEDDGYLNNYNGEFDEECHEAEFNQIDMQIKDFMEWFKQQPEYENTTIVITGDHLSHSLTYFEQFGDYDRTVYSVFINADTDNGMRYIKTYSTLDMFPSTLAAMGVEINGNRLGLGTNIFSDTITLCEKLSVQELNKMLENKTSYYINNIENKQ